MRSVEAIKLFTNNSPQAILQRLSVSQFGLRSRVYFWQGETDLALEQLLEGIEVKEPESQALAFAIGDRRRAWIEQRINSKDASIRNVAQTNMLQVALEEGNLSAAKRSKTSLQQAALWKQYIQQMTHNDHWIRPPTPLMAEQKKQLLPQVGLGWYSPAQLDQKASSDNHYTETITILTALRSDINQWANRQWKEIGFQLDLAIALAILGLQEPACQSIGIQAAKCLTQYDTTNDVWKAIYYRLKANGPTRNNIVPLTKKLLNTGPSPASFVLSIETLRVCGQHNNARLFVEKATTNRELQSVAQQILQNWHAPKLHQVTIHRQQPKALTTKPSP